MPTTHRSMVATRLALLLAVMAGCAAPGSDGVPGPGGPAPTADAAGRVISAVARIAADPAHARLAADAANDFGLALLRAGTSSGENSVISPASIVLALGMARPGARGETAAEMDRVLREVASDDHAMWLNALDAELSSRTGTFTDRSNKPANVVLRIANTTFAQQDFAWNPAYLDALAARFGAGVNLVDYINASEPARLAINAWVEGRTERRIPELLPPGSVDELTRLVLVNAVYLKAAWRVPFDEEATIDAPFTTLGGSRIDVLTMRQTISLPYAAGDGWRAVELPYVDEKLAMLLIVPDDLGQFEGSLDGEAFAGIVGALEDTRVALSLPKFGLETKLELKDALAGLGMPRAFDPSRADFSGMSDAADLFITAVVHQANLDLDEDGTEAAAATAVVVGIVSKPPDPITMNVDRPFLFALRDRPTGAILFLGRVVQPQVRD